MARPVLDVLAPRPVLTPTLGQDSPAVGPTAVSRLVGEALVRTASDHRWTVTCVEYPYGVVRLERRARLTQIVVGERMDSTESSPSAESFAAAACTADGELLVAVRSAPPAIVVGSDPCRTRPSDGSAHDSAFPCSGERLILLSCAAFEAVPDVLVDGVSGAPSTFLATGEPEAVLIALLRDAGRGAGAIIEHHPTTAGGSS